MRKREGVEWGGGGGRGGRVEGLFRISGREDKGGEKKKERERE